jgi:type IV pilus assembly protein PilA
MKNLSKKKGFTLIELMIVLAIIAILAVVLVPKAGVFKKQTKAQGVVTNVNVVRAYLETKTGDKKLDNAALLTSMVNSFTGDEELTNPIENGGSVIDDEAVTGTATTPNLGTSVVVMVAMPTQAAVTADAAKYKGVVIVAVPANAGYYLVNGVDLDGNYITNTHYKILK